MWVTFSRLDRMWITSFVCLFSMILVLLVHDVISHVVFLDMSLFLWFLFGWPSFLFWNRDVKETNLLWNYYIYISIILHVIKFYLFPFLLYFPFGVDAKCGEIYVSSMLTQKDCLSSISLCVIPPFCFSFHKYLRNDANSKLYYINVEKIYTNPISMDPLVHIFYIYGVVF